MVRAAQTLVSSLTSLLILADMLDVHLLMMKVEAARQELERMREVVSQQDLMEWMRRLEAALAVLRQRELKDSGLRSSMVPSDKSALQSRQSTISPAVTTSLRQPLMLLLTEVRDRLRPSHIYPGFSLVELSHYCPLIGRELHSVAGASSLMP